LTSREKERKLNIQRLFFLVFVVLVLAAVGAGTGFLFVSVKDMPVLNPASLQSGATTMIYDKDGKLVTKVGIKNNSPVDFNNIPQVVQDAFLAIEDPSFYRHHGISLRGIARAAWSDLRSGEIREGGSTITQQLVKVSYLSQEQTFKRKIQEAVLSIQLERRYTKEEILEMYLNNIYLGEGCYGIQAAAQTYFGKDIGEVTKPEEAALIAGLPQAPTAYSPYRNPQLALQRRNAVLDSMLKNNYISEAQHQQAKSKELKIDTREPSEKQYPYPYFLDYVTDKLIEKYGESEVFKGGLRVYTSLDPKIQQIAESAMARLANFPPSGSDASGILQPQGAMVIMDPNTGYIKALVGGREHTQKRQWNRATQSARQPGSAFKPIAAYGPALEQRGMGPASVVDDVPVKYGSYEPRNNDGAYRGLITLRKALTSSVNVVAVKLLVDTVSISESIQFAGGLGINLDPAMHGASMALGGLHSGVSPLQMAGAYSALANNGVYIEPTAITQVKRADGVILDQAAPKQRQAMKATTAYLITDMLKSAVQSGTGAGAQIGRPVAGKTGTTDDGKDIWFVGYTPELVASVWIGHDQPAAMPFAYGGTYPARIWREVMSQALANQPVRDFQRPDGIVTATVDGKSGLLPGPNTPAGSLVTDLFAAGTVPTAVDNVHVFMEVCAASGQLPNEYCPDRVIRQVIKLPYNVPYFVHDYNLRAPTRICTLHGPGSANNVNPAIPGAKPKENPGVKPNGNPGAKPNENNKPGQADKKTPEE